MKQKLFSEQQTFFIKFNFGKVIFRVRTFFQKFISESLTFSFSNFKCAFKALMRGFFKGKIREVEIFNKNLCFQNIFINNNDYDMITID